MPTPENAARCPCCDMPLGREHRVEADMQACGPCLRAENEARDGK